MNKTRERKSKIWARDPDDWYIEDSWCSRRLFEEEPFEDSIIDPACGIGRIVASARTVGLFAVGADIIKRSEFCCHQKDFLSDDWSSHVIKNIVCNPPFAIADKFVELALERAWWKVAMLLPATWHFGDKRARWLKTTPLRRILALTPRPSMPPGAVIMSGEKPGGGTKDFAWYIWQRGWDCAPEIGWLHRDK